MVMRSSDAPSTLPARVQDARARADELARQQGRGSTALRNRSHALYLDPASPEPLLTPTDVDSGLRFGDTEVAVVSEDGTETRAFRVRDLIVEGTLTVEGGATITGNAGVKGNVNIDGNLRALRGSVSDAWAVDSSYTIGNTPQGDPTLYAPSDDASLVAFNGDLYVANNSNTVRRSIIAANSPASERALKDPVADLDGALEVVRSWRPGRFTWKPGTPYDDGREHAAVYVDELDETAPEAVAAVDRDGNRIPDERAMIAYLTAAVQELAAEVERLRAERPVSPSAQE